ncbi:MAG: TolC family protein [Candidatus Lernaella stagnicola]|nr:TolC family protein [Candidatus Lernaella stagnicola]
MNGKFPSPLQMILIVLILFIIMAPGAALGADAWTLDAAIDYALAHNPDLAEVRAQTAVAEESRREVFGNFLPKLTGTAGYQYIGNVPEIQMSFTPDIPIPNIPPIKIERDIRMGDEDNWSASVALEQLVFASGRVYYGHQAASLQVEATEQQAEVARLMVAQKTAEAFLGVLITTEVHKAQEESLARARAHLTDVQNRHNAGAASRFELLRAQVEVDNIEPAVTKAANAVALTKQGLRRALGLPEDAPVAVQGTLETTALLADEAAARQAAQRQRPEFDVVRTGTKAYERLAKSRLGEMLPAVMLTGSYGYQKPYFFDEEGDTNWTVGVGIQVPLFDGLKAWRGRGANLARAEQTRLSGERIAADIDTQIRSAVLALGEAGTRITTTRANVERAGKMVRMAQESYAYGALTSLDVIDAQLAATGAQLAHLEALYDYRVAKVRYAAAMGDRQAIRR